jgi:hypothetical protein
VSLVCDLSGMLNETLRVIDSFNSSNTEINMLCAGGKIHALAMGFAKMLRPESRFLVRVPTKYTENSTTGTGAYELVFIENVYSPV